MSERILQIDLAIAKLAQEMGTPVVFVRNKAMNALELEREKHPDLEEKELVKTTIEKIKANIIEQLKDVGIKNPTIFVIEANSLRKISKIKLEELALIEYATKLASARSGLKMNDPNACGQMDASLPGASSKNRDVQATSPKIKGKFI
jgi:hypothetical protein